MQCSDTEKGKTRWEQLGLAPHVLPPSGDLTDALLILFEVGFSQNTGEGIRPITGADVLSHLTATDALASPFEVGAALTASRAYVNEHHRSKQQSTDAPFDWPKTERDIQILNEIAEREFERAMGG